MNYELNLTTSRLRRTPPKNCQAIFKRRVTALIGSIVPTKILAEFQEESFRYSRCKDTMQKSEKVAIMKKWSIFLLPGFMRQLNLIADVVFFDRRTEWT